jgi:capsular exopolysaccharide synthesis family protein
MKLSDLRQQLADLSVSFTPSHYSIRRLQAQITEIEQSYERVKALLLKRLANAYEVAGRDEKRLAAAYAEQERLVNEEEQKTIRYNLMKREVDTNRQMYDAMLAKMKEASIASTMLASNMRVIDHAEVPTYADVPSPIRNTTLGLFAGGLFASFILAGLYHFDRSVKLPGDVETYLSIPELGVIPAADSDPSLPPLLGGTRRSLGLRLSGGPTKDEERLEMVTLHHEPSLMAECFRSIAASLLFTDNHGLGARTVAVTSAFPLEGKSTVVSNLGLALAETRHRVLLIDADMRKPRLHSIYGIDNSNGLSNILQGNEDLEALSLDRIIHPTRVAGLYVLPSGPAVRNPANFLYSLRMVELLRKCKAEFEWILFDTPPAIQVVDARVISRLVDGVILVLRAGRTEHELIRSVGKRLSADGTRVVGTILNDWKPEQVYANYYAEHLRHYYES